MQGTEIPRRVRFDKKGEIAAIVMAIAHMDLENVANPRKTDAVVIFPGEGEDRRVFHGVRLWKWAHGSYLLVAGTSKQNIHHFGGFTKGTIAKMSGQHEDNPNILVQEEASNTLEQATWISDIVREKQIQSVTLVASLYHLPRAYLTLLKIFQKNNQKIAIIPSAARCFIGHLSFLSEHPLIPGEVERIIAYQKKGDVATHQELIEHLSWQLAL